MAHQQVPPAGIAQGSGPLGRTNDVGKKDSGQNPIGLYGVADAGEELLSLPDDGLPVAQPIDVVVARSSASLAPGIRCAMYRLLPTSNTRSPVRWSKRVGSRITGKTCRTSISTFIR